MALSIISLSNTSSVSASAKRIVLVVSDPTFTELSSYTKPFYDRLLEYEYDVDVISHLETSTFNFSPYDAAVITWDPTYITEPKNYSNLLSSGIGFVFMSADVEKVGLGSEAGSTSYGTTIDIVNNLNYITWPFSIGSLEVYSESLYRNYMQRAVDTTLLANISEGDIIVVKDKRVYFGLPYGAGLTSNGWKLFDRSVEYATMETPPPSGNHYTYEIIILGTSYRIGIETDGVIGGLTYTNYTFTLSWSKLGTYENITLPRELNNTRIQVMLYWMIQGLTTPKITANETHFFLWSPEQGLDARITKVVFGEPKLSLALSTSTSYVGFSVNITGEVTYRDNPVPRVGVYITYGIAYPQSFITYINTTSEGKFSAIWMPTATGYFPVTAKVWPNPWQVDEAYPDASVDSAFLAVSPFAEEYVFSVVSNATVSELAFNSTSMELSFTVEGESGTSGFIDVYISKALVEDATQIKVYLNSTQLTLDQYTVSSTDDSWHLHLEIGFASKYAVIISIKELEKGIVDYWPYLTAGLIIAVAVGVSIIIRRKLRKTENI